MSALLDPYLTGERRARLVVASQRLLLGAVPVALTAWLAYSAVRFHWYAGDFYDVYYPAAQRLVHGLSPYDVTHLEIVSGAGFVYPALASAAFVPFTLVARGPADHLYSLVCLLCIFGTLRALSVKDWRVYGVTLLWYPMIIGWQGQNISVPLMFLVALTWRYRNRPLAAGLVTAAAISLKPIVWPLALWLLATRRWRAAAWTLGFGLAFNLVAWGLVGFNEIHTYLRLAREDTNALWRGGYSVVAAAHRLGFSRATGEGLLLLASLAVGLALLHVAWVKRRERQAFVLAVALILVAAPLLWIHYFVLLLVPLALSKPRFGPIWLAPLAMWALPSGPMVSVWQVALAWVVIAACFWEPLRGPAAEKPLAGHRQHEHALPDALRPSGALQPPG